MSAIEEPRKPMTAFFIYLKENRAKFVEELGKKATEKGAVASYGSQQWKSLSAEQKKPYEKKAADEKAAYEKAMSDFKAQGGQVGARRAEKRERKEKKEKRAERKASDMPKKPAGGAYGCYVAENRTSIQNSLPAGSKCTEVSKIASERWKKLSSKDKEKFEKQYEEKKAAYEEAMKEWKTKQTTEEGEEDEVLAVPTPAKKARRSASSSKAKNEGSEEVPPPAKKVKGQRPESKTPKSTKKGKPQCPTIDADVLQKAKALGFEGAMNNLLSRPDVIAKEFPHAKLLTALEESEGLVNKAKYKLLGA